jgi:hypothetical protein
MQGDCVKKAAVNPDSGIGYACISPLTMTIYMDGVNCDWFVIVIQLAFLYDVLFFGHSGGRDTSCKPDNIPDFTILMDRDVVVT